MKLYLVRHGDAESGSDDRVRGLSETGIREAGFVGEFLGKQGVDPGIIYHSPLIRAKQTAEILGGRLGVQERLQEFADILPGDPIVEFARFLDICNYGEMIVVTHQPFVSELASYLLSSSELTVSMKFSTGTVASFERSGIGKPWTLKFHVTAGALSRIFS